MKVIPESVSKAWDSRQEIIVFSTVDPTGTPNAIYATCVSKYNDSIFVVADNYFKKTLENIQSGSKASLLFLTQEGASFQVKGTVKYYQNGEIYKDMKKWNPAHLPGNAAAALEVEEVYSGSKKIV